MATTTKNKTIAISSEINAPVQKVWEYWTDPKHIIHWNNASDDWQTSIAENDLRVGGRFMSRMEAKDGSFGFDFTGEYNKIYQYKEIEYTIEDGRVVNVSFSSEGDKTVVTEMFEAEQMNSLEAQQQGWQSILDNFKKYVENSVDRETLHFEISIDAPVEDVYRMMLDEKFYTAWTSVFNPYSHYRGSWEKGSRILFLGNNEEGSIGGMVGRIKENIPNKYVSIEYLGVYKDGYEITEGEEAEIWAGSLENYTFTSEKDKTLLAVDIDVRKDYMQFFVETWPQALEKLKSLCEEA
jgi:uncharacterized protein YndB with AHSA1/START domain